MRYKVIKEYNKFYLCESEKGYKKCLDKYKYKPDENGYIVEENENDYHDSIPKEKWLKIKEKRTSI